jgi:hypothetical protein
MHQLQHGEKAMDNTNISGHWTGEFAGTNQGGFSLEWIHQGKKLSGRAKFMEPKMGGYEYQVQGVFGETVSFQLIPAKNPQGLNLGTIQAYARLIDREKMEGKWKTTVGTEGSFRAEIHTPGELKVALPKPNSIFIVHGHDDAAKLAVARFIEHLGLHPVILHEQINQGMTVIEKFENFASLAGFAVILMTPDDVGYPENNESAKLSRPRQNVVLELGYFAAKLGRSKTFILTKGAIQGGHRNAIRYFGPRI